MAFLQKQGILLCNFREFHFAIPGNYIMQQTNIGYFILQKIYHDLAISSFFKKVTANSKITYEPDLINRFLTYARILRMSQQPWKLKWRSHPSYGIMGVGKNQNHTGR
jgi:hypothetical protein